MPIRPHHVRRIHRHRVALLALVSLATVGAWMQRFIQDDAFISFRYARHLARGEGLVWNPGEPVEGYSNFLWTVLMAPSFTLGVEVVTWSHALGLACFAVNLLLFARLARLLLHSSVAALGATLLLATNRTFLLYGTGGLETGMQTAFVLATLVLAADVTRRPWSSAQLGSVGRLAGLSLTAAAAILTRLDSALLVAPVVATAVVLRARSHGPTPRPGVVLAAACAPGLSVLAAWFIWRHAAYGEWLPNTYWAKLGAPISPRRGLRYLHLFARSYWLYPFLVLFLFCAPRLRARRWQPLFGIALLTAVWLAYVVRTGGDFMEFRFLVPVLPLMLLLTAWCALRVVRRRSLRVALLAVVLAGSVNHTFGLPHLAGNTGVATAELLEGLLYRPQTAWVDIGRALGQRFSRDDGVTIATTPAGAIPFYSDLVTIDMHGLNDAWIARHGRLRGSDLPGHQRVATFDYLLEREVVLVIGQPQLRHVGESWDPAWPVVADFEANNLLTDVDLHNLPPLARIVELPVGAKRFLRMLYLTPNATVDRMIAAGELIARPATGTEL